ncbi:UBC-like protein [Gymnopus androsaceus JB14]|uniref:UBC-like protein n=1 Tax=Gymnopus androsaceus JB14 TaxID=1447944 RepID=A0A6A4ICJ5_9AGAR|nr:UBC-like protein [Gymnopus androsaceus JB14]
MQEARELANDPSTDYSAAPLEDDIFEWHCTIRGPSGTEFEGGLYHLRILLPAEYPFRPPSLMLLTPNGRFELNTKICISFTNYHEELWQPSWGVRTAILGIQSFLPLKGQAAVGIGSIEYPAAERKRLAALSRQWVCPHCQQSNLELLPDPGTTAAADDASTETETVSRAKVPAAAALRASESSSTTPPTLEIVEQGTTSPSSESPRMDDTTTSSPAVDSAPPSAVAANVPTISRPPMLLDALIGIILTLVLALLFKRIL